MIASLRGKLIDKDAQYAVIDCGGVGYQVGMSLTSLARLGAVGQDVFVLVHTHLSQDALRLFGFIDAAEKQTFGILLTTAGVGPRLALTILSTLTPIELAEAVLRQDKATLTQIGGVGAKKAARLLVELKDRLPSFLAGATGSGKGKAVQLLTDVQSALENLGFAQNLAEQAAKKVLQGQEASLDVAQLVRKALQQLAGRPPKAN